MLRAASQGVLGGGRTWARVACDAPSYEGKKSNESDDRVRADSCVGEPTCACVARGPIVLGLLFTMKIPTQNCKRVRAWRRNTQHQHFRCCASGGEDCAGAPDFLVLFTGAGIAERAAFENSPQTSAAAFLAKRQS